MRNRPARYLLLCFAVALMIGAPRPARALDSTRTLTQALHRIWQMPQGLPEATIYSIRQTQDGYLWLGTQTGLVRFDGVRFSRLDDSKPWVWDMVEDGAGNLWAGTNGKGLLQCHGSAITRFTETEGLPSNNVQCLFRDANKNLWVGTSKGIARYVDGTFKVYTTRDGLANDDVRAICQTSDGVLWFAGEGTTISLWNGSTFTRRALTSLPASADLRALLRAQDGTVWIGATAGLVQIRQAVEKLFTSAQGLPDDDIRCLTQGRDGMLWIGTKDGFCRLDKGQFESFRAKDGLSQSTVYTLCEDREGSLWVGTKHGLNQFLDRRTLPFTASEGLSSNDTGPVFQDAGGNIWVGTINAGLNRFDGHRFEMLSANTALAGSSIGALADDGSGGLWVGTDKGISRVRANRVEQTYSTNDGLPAEAVACLLRDSKGTLWAGTSAGPAMLQNGRFVSPQTTAGPIKAPIAALGARHDGSILIATRGSGVYRWADGTLTKFAPQNMARADVDAFFEDHDGLLWMGTIGGGLLMVEGDKTFVFTMRDGLFDDDIFGIIQDDQDRLWMACSKGIFYVRRADLRRFAAGAIARVASAPFSPMDALRTIECKSGVEPAAWRMSDGKLWFSTIRGVIVIDPENLRRDAPPPPVVIEEVIVNGRGEKSDHIAHLPPGVKNIEFRYTALSFLSAGRLTFRYRLEGFDRDWVDAGTRREAFYTNLPPGKFRFRVMASNVDGTTNEAAAPMNFVLAPHLYQRAWFWPVCLALTGLVVWLGYRMRVARIKGRLRDIVTERSRIARELHDTLLQGFSGVTMEMQALSARLPASGERSTLEEIIHDAANCMTEARRSVAGLRNGPGKESGFTAAIAQAARQMTETRDVRLKLKLDESPRGLSADVEYNLLRIAAEAVSNSVKHSGSRTIEVGLDCEPGQLNLSVKDEGSGFDNTRVEGASAGHYGLIGMKERAAQIGADLSFVSTPGRGTLVRVALPLKDRGASMAAQKGSSEDL
jgi:ligand-binding sensor domain-containing protein/signal transduction histidine kinase